MSMSLMIMVVQFFNNQFKHTQNERTHPFPWIGNLVGEYFKQLSEIQRIFPNTHTTLTKIWWTQEPFSPSYQGEKAYEGNQP